MSHEPTIGELGGCCEGAASGHGCTCWEPVYSEPQAPMVEPMPPLRVRAGGCCGSCGIVDRLDDVLGIRDAAILGRPFFCHQGFRRVLHYAHPDGRTKPADAHDYPESLGHYVDVDHNRIPLKVDGTPGDLCAGWAKWAREAGHRWFDRGEAPPPGKPRRTGW